MVGVLDVLREVCPWFVLVMLAVVVGDSVDGCMDRSRREGS